MSIEPGVTQEIIVWALQGAFLVTGILIALRESGVPVADAPGYHNDRETRLAEAQKLLIFFAATSALWFGLQVVYALGRQVYFRLFFPAGNVPPELFDLETAVVPAAACLIAFAGATIGLTLAPGGLLRSVGLTRAFFLRAGLPALVGLMIMLPLVNITSVFTEWVYRYFHVSHEPAHKLILVLRDPQGGSLVRLMVIVAAVIAAPLFEELAFRGLLQGMLARFTGRPWVGVLLGATAFAVLHDPWTWPAIFVIGACGGIAYERTKNLWVAILIHAGFNATSIVAALIVSR